MPRLVKRHKKARSWGWLVKYKYIYIKQTLIEARLYVSAVQHIELLSLRPFFEALDFYHWKIQQAISSCSRNSSYSHRGELSSRFLDYSQKDLLVKLLVDCHKVIKRGVSWGLRLDRAEHSEADLSWASKFQDSSVLWTWLELNWWFYSHTAKVVLNFLVQRKHFHEWSQFDCWTSRGNRVDDIERILDFPEFWYYYLRSASEWANRAHVMALSMD